TGIVLHFGGGHQCAPELGALEDERLQLGPGGVDRRGVPRGAGPDDDHVVDGLVGHMGLSALRLAPVFNTSLSGTVPGGGRRLRHTHIVTRTSHVPGRSRGPRCHRWNTCRSVRIAGPSGPQSGATTTATISPAVVPGSSSSTPGSPSTECGRAPSSASGSV